MLTADSRVLALHVACDACRATSRLTMAEQVEDWFCAHFQPSIVSAECVIAGEHRSLPVQVIR